MPGAVRYHHVANVVEQIKDQLSGWKGRLLSFQDRVVLVKSVIASYSVHNMVVYKWPRKFVHECEVAIRNFLWSGDSKIFYEKWNLVHYIKSSILPGIKWAYSLVEDNTKVLIGDGRNTSLFYDVWVGDTAIADILEDYSLNRVVLVSDILVNGAWNLIEDYRSTLLAAGIEEVDLPFILDGDDCQVWMPSTTGQFTAKAAKSFIRKRYGKLEGANLLWRQSVHPALAARNWKILKGVCSTLDQVRSRFKIQVVNKCCLCNSIEESLDHLLWRCRFVEMACSWISDIFRVQLHLNLTTAYKEVRGRSGMIKELWLLAVLVVRSELWQTRNRFVYDNKKVRWSFFKTTVFNQIQEYSGRLKGYMYNTVDDLRILDFFKVRHRQVKLHDPVECRWVPPEVDELMLCCDGAARGNPEVVGAGVVARDHDANVIGVMSIVLGVMTNYIAEISSIIIGMEWALQWGYSKVCIRSDSLSAVMTFTTSNLPWFVIQRWSEVSSHYETIRFDHTYREANFAADKMAKRGCILTNEEGRHYLGKPDS
ncbi:uncharacterized protein LOC113356215 [Papaver somniferum]|uniref:uncharacterized protein LOC113356215 n=1 Tax=Papaver somniferum TaxID=3469 RepID=UPI000E6FEBFD|nr:uncharacterized protein LOC113356215 [Papaver somniferum]